MGGRAPGVRRACGRTRGRARTRGTRASAALDVRNATGRRSRVVTAGGSPADHVEAGPPEHPGAAPGPCTHSPGSPATTSTTTASPSVRTCTLPTVGAVGLDGPPPPGRRPCLGSIRSVGRHDLAERRPDDGHRPPPARPPRRRGRAAGGPAPSPPGPRRRARPPARRGRRPRARRPSARLLAQCPPGRAEHRLPRVAHRVDDRGPIGQACDATAYDDVAPARDGHRLPGHVSVARDSRITVTLI